MTEHDTTAMADPYGAQEDAWKVRDAARERLIVQACVSVNWGRLTEDLCDAVRAYDEATDAYCTAASALLAARRSGA